MRCELAGGRRGRPSDAPGLFGYTRPGGSYACQLEGEGVFLA